jgi:hypothetical protein
VAEAVPAAQLPALGDAGEAPVIEQIVAAVVGAALGCVVLLVLIGFLRR